MSPRVALACLLLAVAPGLASAQPKPRPRPDLTDLLPLLDAKSPEALAGVLRGAMLKYLPDPIYEASPGWGEKRTVNALHFKHTGSVPRPTMEKAQRNHGVWRKIRLSARDLPNTLILDVRNVQFPDPSRMTFEVFLSFDAYADFEQQNWERGVRVWSGSVRARFRLKLQMACEATTKLDPSKNVLVPDAVFRVRATSAKVTYDNLVFEHVPGLGGSAAKLVGNTFHSALTQWRPSMERSLLAKADAAILRAADSREVRISLARMFSSALGQQK
jgi:hypothetical protein